MYPHNHSPAYNFLQDGPMVTVTEDRVTGAPIPPTVVRGESGKRLMQHYLDITDPRLCRRRDGHLLGPRRAAPVALALRLGRATGSRTSSTRLRQVARQTKRYALFHAKDGDRTTEAPGVGNGYNFIPFGDPRSDIDFERFFGKLTATKRLPQPELRAGQRARRRPPTPASPCASAKISAANMLSLRG